MLPQVRPFTSAVSSSRLLLDRWRTRREVWRLKGTFWTIFPRWQLWGLFLLVMASVFFLAYRISVWGVFLVLTAMSYLARCFEETWDEVREAHATQLLARSREAQQVGNLNRALRLARTAWSLTRNASCHDRALEQQARILLLQGHGVAALRELSRTFSNHTPSPALRVQAHLMAGESSIALALARRMFAREPSPDTAHLIARAFIQLQRPEEARHFSSLAGQIEESPAVTPPLGPPAAPALRPSEVHLPLGFMTSWMLATTVGALLVVAMGLSLKWGPKDPFGTYGPWFSFALGALEGGLLGLAQWWVLRRMFPEAGRWPWLTALGYGLGMMATHLLTQWIGLRPPPHSLLTDAMRMSLRGLVAMCFQALVLGRWIRGSATWLLAMMGAAPLAEFILLGLLGWLWQAESLPAWLLAVLTLGDRVGPALLGALIRGLLLGGVGGALLHRELARERRLYPAPPPRPLAADYPHVFARTRPCALQGEELPEQLPVAPMLGPLFCPGADAFFNLPEAQYTRRSQAFTRHFSVIVPMQAETTPWPGESAPQVGVLIGLYKAAQVRPGGDYQMTVRMLARVRLRDLVLSEQGPLARVELIEDFPSTQPQAQLDRLRYRLNDYIRSTPDLELEDALRLRDPVFLADLTAANLELSPEERRELLEDLNPDSRITKVCEWLDRALLDPPRLTEGPRVRIEPIHFLHAWGE